MSPSLQWKKQIPEGVQDLLPAACFHKRQLEIALRRSFFLHGYDEIETPCLEYFDVFHNGVGGIAQEAMMKLQDASGRILVLRPDITTPVARLISSRLQQERMPMRLCYIGDAFEALIHNKGRQCEFTQAGVELIGAPGMQADAEVLGLAICSLIGCGLQAFQIDIGQIDFFIGLLEECGLTDDECEQLRQGVESKDLLSLEVAMKEMRIPADKREAILRMPMLFGGRDVIEEAAAMTSSEKCQRALTCVREVYDMLCEEGLEAYLSIDLGLVPSLQYYSGIVFRGVADGIGFAILKGGRYDPLLSEFDCARPATGFAIDVMRVLVALESQGALGVMPKTDLLVAYARPSHAKAMAYIEAQRHSGARVEVSFAGDATALFAEAAQRKTDAVYWDEAGVSHAYKKERE